MKKSEDWINEWSQSGALDQVGGQTSLATELIESIQKDAYTNPPTYGELNGIPPTFPPEPTDEEAIHELNRIIEDLQFRFAIKNHKLLLMRKKWHEARRYLRAANKGAARNAMVAEIATLRQITQARLHQSKQP